MKNVPNEQDNPSTTTSLTTKKPSITKSSLICLPCKEKQGEITIRSSKNNSKILARKY